MKYLKNLLVVSKEQPRADYVMLRLKDVEAEFPEILPGQFVELRVEGSPTTMLRRPISVHYVDRRDNTLWLLVHIVGEGTHALAKLEVGDRLDCLYPLGNGFTVPAEPAKKMLLVGGGVGTAPMLYYGAILNAAGHDVTFLLGGRRAEDILYPERFELQGRVCVTTEDASLGEKGFVTNHSILSAESFDAIAACGPKPMMMAVARYARQHNIPCEVSLENMMACGLGACLCCVEKTVRGNVCVCKEGPVFSIEQLNWE